MAAGDKEDSEGVFQTYLNTYFLPDGSTQEAHKKHDYKDLFHAADNGPSERTITQTRGIPPLA